MFVVFTSATRGVNVTSAVTIVLCSMVSLRASRSSKLKDGMTAAQLSFIIALVSIHRGPQRPGHGNNSGWPTVVGPNILNQLLIEL